ncbi:MAG: hypothetical protein ACRDMV_19990 [Streptosporangiales bacterium]
MSVYRCVWLTVACTLAAAGIGLTFLALPVAAVVDAVIAGAFVGGAAAAVTLHWLAGRPPSTGRQVVVGTRVAVRDVAAAGIAGATVGLALAGTIDLLGAMAFGMDLIVGGVLVASSPPAIRRYAAGPAVPTEPAPAPLPAEPRTAPAPTESRTAPAPPREAAPPREPALEALALRSLSYAELCRAWHASYGELAGTGDAADRSRLALTRRSYLDEFERRDPAAFTRWLADIARAAVNPASSIPTPSPRPNRHGDEPRP